MCRQNQNTGCGCSHHTHQVVIVDNCGCSSNRHNKHDKHDRHDKQDRCDCNDRHDRHDRHDKHDRHDRHNRCNYWDANSECRSNKSCIVNSNVTFTTKEYYIAQYHLFP